MAERAMAETFLIALNRDEQASARCFLLKTKAARSGGLYNEKGARGIGLAGRDPLATRHEAEFCP